MPQGKGTYGSKKGRPPKKKAERGKPPGMLKKITTGNPFSAGASTTKKKGMPTAGKKAAGKQKLAAMYGDPKKITRGDIITAAKMKKKKR
jgi:hypothetical protein